MRVAREALSFSEAENKALDFKQEGEQLRWTEGVAEKDLNIGEIVTEMIKKKLKELNDKEDLEPQQFTLYEKFVLGE